MLVGLVSARGAAHDGSSKSLWTPETTEHQLAVVWLGMIQVDHVLVAFAYYKWSAFG